MSEERTVCETVVRQLWQYLDGSVPPDKRELVEAHLEVCVRCASHYEFARSFLVAVAASPPMPGRDDTLRSRVVGALAREVILLIDHSGSMEGAKWEAADWAVQNLLAGLTPGDTFNLGLFHTTTRWFARQPVRGDERTVKQARDFLLQHKDSGGTELGVALEQALGQARDADARARHVLIVTDAQVSDAGRILALVERE